MARREPALNPEPADRPENSSDRLPATGRPVTRRMDTRTQVISLLWAVLPLATFGLATPVTFLWAAKMRRSRHFLVAAVVYAVMVVLGFALPNAGIATAISTVTWLVGTPHALLYRSSVFGRRPPVRQTAIEAAIDAARQRRELRRQALRLADHDPGLARELGIGRPDKQRDFDDGGLVDVNSVPAEVLARLPGMTAAMAGRIVEVREISGPYGSVEELSVLAEIAPDLADRLAEYLLFLHD